MQNYVWMLDKLTPVEKYVMGYLVSSPHLTNDWGYYHIPIAYLMADLGLTRAKAENAMKGLIEKKLVSYDQEQSVVAIANYNRYSEKTSQDICGKYAFSHTLDSLIHIPPSGVFSTTKEWVCAYAPEDTARTMETNPWVKEALSKDVPVYTGTIKRKKKAIPKGATELFTKESAIDGKPVDSHEEEGKPSVPAAEDVPVQEQAATKAPETAADGVAPTQEEPSKQSKTKKEKELDPVAKQHEDEFEALWAKYPRKSGKKAAHDGYFKMLKDGEITFAVASKALDKYIYECKKKGTEKQYIMNGSTFFGAQKRVLEFVEDEAVASQAEKDRKLKTQLMPKFNMFWITYPRKEGKEIAENHFLEIVKSGDYTPEQLLEAATAYASECQSRNTDKMYIKRADTFLDPTTRPFRDYLNRDELNSYYVNTQSKQVEKIEPNEYTEADFLRANGKEVPKTQEEISAACKALIDEMRAEFIAQENETVDTPKEDNLAIIDRLRAQRREAALADLNARLAQKEQLAKDTVKAGEPTDKESTPAAEPQTVPEVVPTNDDSSVSEESAILSKDDPAKDETTATTSDNATQENSIDPEDPAWPDEDFWNDPQATQAPAPTYEEDPDADWIFS